MKKADKADKGDKVRRILLLPCSCAASLTVRRCRV